MERSKRHPNQCLALPAMVVALAMAGTGSALAQMDFGAVKIGESRTLPWGLGCPYAQGCWTISGWSVVGGDASEFAVSTDCVGKPLPYGAGCTFNITFTPKRPARCKSARLLVYDPAGQIGLYLDMVGEASTTGIPTAPCSPSNGPAPGGSINNSPRLDRRLELTFLDGVHATSASFFMSNCYTYEYVRVPDVTSYTSEQAAADLLTRALRALRIGYQMRGTTTVIIPNGQDHVYQWFAFSGTAPDIKHDYFPPGDLGYCPFKDLKPKQVFINPREGY